MRKADIANEIYEKVGVSKKEASDIVELVLNLLKTVLQKGESVTIAGGSRVRGRVRRMERYTAPSPHFVVAIEFTEVESEGIRYRFYADLVSMDSAAGVEERLATNGKEEVRNLPDHGMYVRNSHEELWLPSLPGVAVFFVRGAKLELPQGFRTIWKTRPVGP